MRTKEPRAQSALLPLLIAMSMLSFAGSARAIPVHFNLAYTETSLGGSIGTGSFSVDDSLLGSNRSHLLLGRFLDSLTITFLNTGLPSADSVIIDLNSADFGAFVLVTDGAGKITGFNFWSYNRLISPTGPNLCFTCTEIYLGGEAALTAALIDPTTGDKNIYQISVTPIPEPATAVLIAGGLAILGLRRDTMKN